MATLQSIFMPLLFFSVAAAFTPGPNNIMLTASGANFGFQRTVPHMVGIVAGFFVLLLAVSMGLGMVFTAYPVLQEWLKLLGCAYLLYFAWRIANSRRSQGSGQGRPFSIIEAAGFQFINPKGWLMGLSAVTAFTVTGDAYLRSAGMVIGVFSIVTLLAVMTWALFGTAIGRLLKTARAFRVFNIVMALLTAGSVVLLFI